MLSNADRQYRQCAVTLKLCPGNGCLLLQFRPLLSLPYAYPPLCFGRSIQPILNDTRIRVPPLTDLLPPQVLEPWPERTVHIMVLSCKPILPFVAQLIKLVAPMAGKVEPRSGGVWRGGGGAKDVRLVIVGVCMSIQCWIPERTAVCGIVEKTKRKNIGVFSRRRIHGMRTNGAVDDWLK